jgi:hypothetical protein
MTTIIDREFDRLTQSVSQTLVIHQQQLELEREQIKCLTQLLSSCVNFRPDENCLMAIKRLTELLESHQQSATQVVDVLQTLTQAKDTLSLTIDSRGEIATCLKLELGELAQRLKIDKFTQLSTAAHHLTDWARLMTAHPDPDGYQWQFPLSKPGFYHNARLQIIGTKTVSLESGSASN